MRILEYIGLNTRGVEVAYQRVSQAIAVGDFRAAQVKKLVGPVGAQHTPYWRAKLNDADRLLFTLLRHGDEVCALMLEVIRQHDYAGSRFLRGASIDEQKIVDCAAPPPPAEVQPVRYLHPQRKSVHLLDKPISFDDAQHEVFCKPAPLIVVGSAGSGKTALTLEKLKHAEGEVLYVTRSAYLAQSARDLYYAHGFEHSGQEALFLSYREFIEAIEVPQGREVSWRDFFAWFARQRQNFRDLDAHQAWEEIRGVITAAPGGPLDRESYLALGVRQSIHLGEARARLYDLFEKYRAWLADSGLYDLNLIAHAYLAKATPRYDFVVIDEVQDITPVELKLVLKTLKKPGHFLLCGDSNQIVHPNFFSWAQVKSLFWQDAALAERQPLSVLHANYRNGQRATQLANRLLKIKQRRFGSIDRESNFLVEAVGGREGRVDLLADKEAICRELDGKIRHSTEFAVLVLRDEDKPAARRLFSTPLLFSVHEAKGLEYRNIVLYRFISDHRAEFAEIAEGVSADDLASDTLDYRRARDKSDKALEIYKFYVNALYVALTRATENLYLVESDTRHPLFGLLEVGEAGRLQVEAKQASIEDWQKEARKLELQGKQEQAEAIHRDILRQSPPPWPVLDEPQVIGLMVKVFQEQVPGSKPRQQLYDYATCFDEPRLAHYLAQVGRFNTHDFARQRTVQARKTMMPYFASNPREVIRQCEQYGLEHRLPMNQTPLMAAAFAGNVALVEALIERGADREATDQYGWNPLHYAMREAFAEAKFAKGPFAALYELLAPSYIDLSDGHRLIRIDRHQYEYFLVQTFWVFFRRCFAHGAFSKLGTVSADPILDAWQHLPANAVPPARKKRQTLHGVLARNEVDRDYAYNRRLFKRHATGHYQFNPQLKIRRRRGEVEVWLPVFQALNLPLVAEFAWRGPHFDVGPLLMQLCREAGLPPLAPPIAAALIAREEQAIDERARQQWIGNSAGQRMTNAEELARLARWGVFSPPHRK